MFSEQRRWDWLPPEVQREYWGSHWGWCLLDMIIWLITSYLVDRQLDHICIDIWTAVMTNSLSTHIAERQGTAMYYLLPWLPGGCKIKLGTLGWFEHKGSQRGKKSCFYGHFPYLRVKKVWAQNTFYRSRWIGPGKLILDLSPVQISYSPNKCDQPTDLLTNQPTCLMGWVLEMLTHLRDAKASKNANSKLCLFETTTDWLADSLAHRSKV